MLYERFNRIISVSNDYLGRVVDYKLLNKIGIQGISQRDDIQISQLRGMLSMSNGSCVMNFLKSETNIIVLSKNRKQFHENNKIFLHDVTA